jgi:hypothetical protein
MHFRNALLVASFLLLSTSAFSQSDATRNARASEIEGYWQLVPLPDALEPKLLRTNPWPEQCQWFTYGNDGIMKSIHKLRGPCELNSKEQLQKIFSTTPAVVSWSYDFSATYQKGVLIINRSDVKGYGEIWEPQIVVKPFINGEAEFREGDLILYLSDLKEHKMTWIRHLRKVI